MGVSGQSADTSMQRLAVVQNTLLLFIFMYLPHQPLGGKGSASFLVDSLGPAQSTLQTSAEKALPSSSCWLCALGQGPPEPQLPYTSVHSQHSLSISAYWPFISEHLGHGE